MHACSVSVSGAGPRSANTAAPVSPAAFAASCQPASASCSHPVCCAASLAAVTEIIDRDLPGNAKKVGAYFIDKLSKLPHVKEARGQGLFVGVEFDGTINAVDVKHGCFDRKLLITAIGKDVIRMVPPLIITEEDVDKAVSIIADTIDSLSK